MNLTWLLILPEEKVSAWWQDVSVVLDARLLCVVTTFPPPRDVYVGLLETHAIMTVVSSHLGRFPAGQRRTCWINLCLIIAAELSFCDLIAARVKSCCNCIRLVSMDIGPTGPSVWFPAPAAGQTFLLLHHRTNCSSVWPRALSHHNHFQTVLFISQPLNWEPWKSG